MPQNDLGFSFLFVAVKSHPIWVSHVAQLAIVHAYLPKVVYWLTHLLASSKIAQKNVFLKVLHNAPIALILTYPSPGLVHVIFLVFQNIIPPDDS